METYIPHSLIVGLSAGDGEIIIMTTKGNPDYYTTEACTTDANGITGKFEVYGKQYPAILGRELKESDIGSPVTYIPDHACGDINHVDCERGHISSFNKESIWVRFKSATGENTPPENLIWG